MNIVEGLTQQLRQFTLSWKPMVQLGYNLEVYQWSLAVLFKQLAQDHFDLFLYERPKKPVFEQ